MYLLLIEYRCQIKDIYIFYGGNIMNDRIHIMRNSDALISTSVLYTIWVHES